MLTMCACVHIKLPEERSSMQYLYMKSIQLEFHVTNIKIYLSTDRYKIEILQFLKS